MKALVDFAFKHNTKRRKSKPSAHSTPVCEVIICNTETGRVERKPFRSWTDARDYVHCREGSRKYRVSIERV